MKPKHAIVASCAESGYWQEVWRSHELLSFLSWQAVRLRYRQTLAGALWTLLRPVLLTLALTLVFSGFVGLTSTTPYTIVTLAGVAPWVLVSSILTSCCFSISQHHYFISKVYFPRILLPASMVLLNLLDFLIVLVLLGLLMTAKGYLPTHRILWLPVILAYTVFASLSLGIWLASLNIRYRDIGIALPFIIQVGALVSPVGFTIQVVPMSWRPWFALNPMVGIIELFRYSLLKENVAIYWPGVVISIITVTAFFFSGLIYFRKSERLFLDHA